MSGYVIMYIPYVKDLVNIIDKRKFVRIRYIYCRKRCIGGKNKETKIN